MLLYLHTGRNHYCTKVWILLLLPCVLPSCLFTAAFFLKGVRSNVLKSRRGEALGRDKTYYMLWKSKCTNYCNFIVFALNKQKKKKYFNFCSQLGIILVLYLSHVPFYIYREKIMLTFLHAHLEV